MADPFFIDPTGGGALATAGADGEEVWALDEGDAGPVDLIGVRRGCHLGDGTPDYFRGCGLRGCDLAIFKIPAIFCPLNTGKF